MPRPLGAVLLIALGGCARSPVSVSPSPLLGAYCSAVTGDDPRAAYLLLAIAARIHLSEAEFTARWRSTVDERQSQAAGLKQALADQRVAERAAVRHGERSHELVREAGGWRLAAPGATEPGAATPEEALRRFVDALEQHNLDVLLRLLSDPLRSLVERELGARTAALKELAHQPVSIDGDHARIHYDARFHIDLKRENGAWYISDLN